MRNLDQDERGALDTVPTDGIRAYPLRVLAVKYPRDLAPFYKHVTFEAEKEQVGRALANWTRPRVRVK